MIRTIIIDDEYWVCQLISDLIDWKSYGYEIIGQAYDGENAMKLIHDKHPDIVFTDIRMPGISGIELIEKCSVDYPDVKFVIISGHSDFQYVQEALKNGALGYLLKPVEPDELMNLLDQIKEKIFIAQKKTYEEGLLKKQLNEKKLRLKEQYFLNLFENELPAMLNLTVSQINKECDSTFHDGLFQIIQFAVDNQQPLSPEFYSSAYSMLSKKCYDTISDLCFEMIALRRNTSLIILINFDEANQDEIGKLLRDIFYSYKQNTPYLVNCEVTLGLGKTVKSFADIIESIRTAQEAIFSRIKFGTNKIIEICEEQYNNVEVNDIFTNESKKVISDYLKNNVEYTSLDASARVFIKCIHDDRINPALIIYVAKSVIQYIYSIPISCNLNMDNVIPFEKALGMLDSCYSTEQIISFIASILEDIKKLFNVDMESLSSSEIIKNYLDKNYYKNISLAELSELVFLNSKYISELFKKEIGVTISDYITSRRIKEAKLLLLNSSMQISAVAEKTGYNDAKYFTKLFKRIVGVSPTQFRKMYK